MTYKIIKQKLETPTTNNITNKMTNDVYAYWWGSVECYGYWTIILNSYLCVSSKLTFWNNPSQ